MTGLAGERATHQEVLTLTKRGDQLVCTNAGTSPQGGAGNTTYAFLRSSVVAALGTALAWDQLGAQPGSQIMSCSSQLPARATSRAGRRPAPAI